MSADPSSRADTHLIASTIPAPSTRAVAERFRPQFEASEELLAAVWESRPSPREASAKYQLVLMNVLGRATGTYRALVRLLQSGSSAQAMMLARSLFEDTVTAYWVALPANRDAVVDRIDSQEDSIALHVDDILEKHSELLGVTPSRDPELEARRKRLEGQFRLLGRSSWAPSLRTAIFRG